MENLYLYNTLTRRKEIFKPINKRLVRMYTCGPTVYWFAHIGNLRTYVFEDILKRVLEYNGYKVKHVMNITDVGHLVSDEDVGEDKILVSAKKEKKNPIQLARFYEKVFKRDLKLLNIKKPTILVRATETIDEQIEFIRLIEKRGFAYKIEDGIYFDTSKLRDYGRLWPKKMEISPGKRVEIVRGKKNPTDFALWKFAKERKEMVWNTPWGKGFPGWHTECVVMSKKFLGIPFDIHCGGIDHILIHHTNEIAQAEAAFGKILANYWLHSEFLKVDGKKMAKSLGNIFVLEDLIKRGFHPLALRYFYLSAHYRSPLNFTFEGLKSAQNALENLYQKIQEYKTYGKKSKKIITSKKYKKEFLSAINDDLNTPRALEVIWRLISDNTISIAEKYKYLIEFDEVLGLNFRSIKKLKLSAELKNLIKKREKFRKNGNFAEADKIREKIKKMGYWIEDTKEGPRVKKI